MGRLGDRVEQVLACAREKDAILKDKDAIMKEKDALLKDKDFLLKDKDILLKDKDILLNDKDILLRAERDTVLVAIKTRNQVGIRAKVTLLVACI